MRRQHPPVRRKPELRKGDELATTVGIAVGVNRREPTDPKTPPAIVLIADKQLTYDEQHRADVPIPKWRRVLQHTLGGKRCGWHLLFAGEPDAVDDMLAHLRPSDDALAARATIPTQLEVIDLMGPHIRATWDRVFFNRVLHPRRLNDDLLFRRNPGWANLADKILDDYLEAREKFDKDFGCDLLVCGFDEYHMASIVVLDPHGGTERRNMEGFGIVGSGGELAASRLRLRRSDPDGPLDRAIFNGFDAKVAAEEDIYVGTQLDAWVLVEKVPKEIRIEPDLANDLVEMIQKARRHPLDGTYSPTRADLRRLRKFCADVLRAAT